MESMEGQKNISAGEQKVREYADRIKGGESKDAIMQGLPDSFRSAIEREMQGSGKNEDVKVPPQYKGMSAEAVDIIWTIPEYMDPAKTEQENERKRKVLEVLHAREVERGNDRTKEAQLHAVRSELGIEEDQRELSLEERRKLSGWSASYELARMAKRQGIDLSALSREEYAQFAIDNALAIDDDQLRVAPWQRMGTSVEELVMSNRERRARIGEAAEGAFARFSFEMKQKAGSNDRMIGENIRVRQGTKDSNSWLFFGINNAIAGATGETYKSYVSVKDLNALTPERFIGLMKALRDAGYNGDIKIFQDMAEQGTRLNDQIVMHGNSQEDARLALTVAERFLGNDLDQKSMGKDEVIEGENKSYSQILARRIHDAIHGTDTRK